MPFKSKAQQRKFFAMANRGEISKKKALEWAHETPNIKELPERKRRKKHADSSEEPVVSKKEIRKEVRKLHGLDDDAPKKPARKGRTAKQIAAQVLRKAKSTKTAAISTEDVSRVLAGMAADEEITPEEIAEFAKEMGRAQGRSGALGGGVVGGLSGVLPGYIIGETLTRNPLLGALGALGGALGGAGIGSGLGYLLGKYTGGRFGKHLGEVVQQGQLPAALPYPTRKYLPYTTTEYPELSEPLTPEQYAQLQSQLMNSAMIEGALSGAATPTVSFDEEGNPYSGDAADMAARAAAGALANRTTQAGRLRKIQELRRKGYVDLSNRMLEESM